MASSRRRKHRSKQSDSAALGWLVIIAVVLALIYAVVAAVEQIWPYLLGIVLIVGTVDLGIHLLARRRGEEPPELFRFTRKLLVPFRWIWHFVGGVFGFAHAPPLRVYSVGQLLALTPTEFEEAIAQSLRDHGYRHVHRRGGPGDLGVDITCLDPNGERLAIQCKRYAPGSLVGSRELQLFIGMIHTEHDADRGVYVTTSGFTAPARELAGRHGIRLIDGQELARTFGFDDEPLPVRFRPEREAVVVEGETATRAADGSVFCEMAEDELARLEEMVHELSVPLPIEVVRPLGEEGRRGIRFASTAVMVEAAALLEAAADRADAASASQRPYRRRAQNAVIIDLLRNGGERSYELPRPHETATDP